MKKSYSSHYETPVIQVIVVDVEAGFATTSGSSGPDGTLQFGNDSYAGGGIGKDDIMWGGDF